MTTRRPDEGEAERVAVDAESGAGQAMDRGAHAEAGGAPVPGDPIREALGTVMDPELGVDIVSLGLITAVEVTDADGGEGRGSGGVYVRLRPTSPSCPVGDTLRREAQAAVEAAVGPGVPVRVELDRGLGAAGAAPVSRLGVAVGGGAEAQATAALGAPRVGLLAEGPRGALWRAPFLAVGLATLVVGVIAGLARAGAGWNLPVPGWIANHGALMVSGFLGTVIGLERAVGVGWRWSWAVPILAALGALALVVGAPEPIAPALFTAASLALVGVYGAVLSRRPSGASAVEASGALAWAIGSGVWLGGASFYAVVPWWIAFLVLIIVGERVELSRQVRVAEGRAGVSPAVHLLLPFGALAMYTAGLAALVFPAAWPPIMGAGLVALAAWLWTADAALRTVRRPGLPRFAALCLVSGYAWVTLAAVLLIVEEVPPSGLVYDATLHALFVGFVIAMIFGHAPIIFPAILRRPIPFTRWFYLHLILLEMGLLMRVGGGLAGNQGLRLGGAHAQATALGVFLALTVLAALTARKPQNAPPRGAVP